MNIYGQKSGWRIYLAIFGLIIVAVSLYFSNHLAKELRVSERQQAENVASAYLAISDVDDEEAQYVDFTFFSNVLNTNKTIPLIITDERDNIFWTKNFGEAIDMETYMHSTEGTELRESTEKYLREEMQKLRESGFTPINASGNYIWYKESKVLTQLEYFPLVQFLLIAAFVFFGYLGINAARRSEQNRVWVGMAKETAHQLGTPISAIIAWMEHLKIIRENDREVLGVVDELGKDIRRLELVAERFSKIGSEPKLEPINVFKELDGCRSYMEVRAPRKVSFHFPDANAEALFVDINPPLFDWVVENLLRNALDAMEGKGKIGAEIYQEGDQVCIDLWDTGKGIPSNKFKTVFQPGFTTKKRGWGLGLSLAKRIIEEYHRGKIFVKKSAPGEGTTFTIRLPKSKNIPTSKQNVQGPRAAIVS
ncbi:sensor histidine kinase [Flavilitoribacter nigricans]|uniref:histidine kinase n=1 Tax=Flavilitoribacter nigricans (strain ATCC 23147 / DSM 23189 / NBRC 102662 / NCIMB 1420 / SS-2) TaxID=1122177 RepID=A0A2D0N4H2_FLAN2|nr:HAMP domain-containing sensor histidine kinase [Flavilitoribacter nigricans]PHN03385.1 two-component sensor histidine kinase [Flavilitoribacter nigricans DSM 23189 = NBRC 102662]